MTYLRNSPRLGVLAAFGWSLAFTYASAAEDITFFTGSPGGAALPMGGAMKPMFEKEVDGLAVEVRPGGGLLNLVAVHEGKADIAFANVPSTVDALKGQGLNITEPLDKICHVANLYSQVQHTIVKDGQGIESFADLKGRSVGVMPKGHTAQAIASMLFEVAGLQEEDLNVNNVTMGDQANMFRDGQIDASFLIVGVPGGAVMDMASARDIKILDITDEMLSDVQAINSGYYRYIIPAGTYPGQEKDAKTMHFSAHLIARCDLDEQIVYGITKALSENIAELENINSVFKGATPGLFGSDSAVPFHEGALRYYKEIGVQ